MPTSQSNIQINLYKYHMFEIFNGTVTRILKFQTPKQIEAGIQKLKMFVGEDPEILELTNEFFAGDGDVETFTLRR